MLFEQLITTGARRNAGYLIGDPHKRELVVVDMGYQVEQILARVETLGYRLKYMFATHRHQDHIGRPEAIRRFRKLTGAKLAAYKTIEDLERRDKPLDDGDVVCVGNIKFEVIHTPGHTLDSVCFLVNGKKVLTGDTLYVGRVPKGTHMRMLFDSLHQRVLALPDHIEVWPGHDRGPKASSTIGYERRTNAVLQMSYRDFCCRRWNGKKWVA